MQFNAATATPLLAHLAQRGEREAFCLLVQRFERAALSVAYSIVIDFATAGDVVQESFLQAWRHLAELRETERFEAWLMQLVRRRAIDARRRAASRVALGMQSDGDADSVAAALPDLQDARETREQIAAAMAELDDISRQVVAMRYFENCSSRQIGERLGLSPAAIDMRLHRAREVLRVKLANLAAP